MRGGGRHGGGTEIRDPKLATRGPRGELANLARARLALGDGILAAGSSREAIALVRHAADELAPHRKSADDIWSMLERWLAEHDPKHAPKARAGDLTHSGH